LICPPPPGLVPACLLFTSWVSPACLLFTSWVGSGLLLILLLLRWILSFRYPLPWPCWWCVGMDERTVVCSPGGFVNGCFCELSRAMLILPWSSAPGVGVLMCLHAFQQPAP
jgi:integral membrane sensor domain MASE1